MMRLIATIAAPIWIVGAYFACWGLGGLMPEFAQSTVPEVIWIARPLIGAIIFTIGISVIVGVVQLACMWTNAIFDAHDAYRTEKIRSGRVEKIAGQVSISESSGGELSEP